MICKFIYIWIQVFTYHIVNIKLIATNVGGEFYNQFTYHIVNIKPFDIVLKNISFYDLHIT